MEENPLRKTPLYALHQALGAKMVPFASYWMPVQYTGITSEHMAVRQQAGLFDVSHMGEVFVSGKEAGTYVQRLVSNDVTKLYDGRVMYSVMCHPNGGIVDDLLVYRFSETEFLLVINAANIEKDVAWMQENLIEGVTLQDRSEALALLAIQGPNAFKIVQKLTDISLDGLKYYHFIRPEAGAFLGCNQAILSHTGYTGEAGLEIYCENERAEAVWNALIEAGEEWGLKPCGLGARDTLRLEAGYCLYGNDLNDETNPLEAGLAWVTKLDKGEFLGREALVSAKVEGLKRKLVAFVMEERSIPRHDYPILNQAGERIGTVTSGTQSPILGKGIGMGYVELKPEYTQPGSDLWIEIRGRGFHAKVHKTPLHKDF